MTMPMSAGQMPIIGRTSVFALAISLGLIIGPDGHAVTMEEAVRAALKTNPDIGAVVENRRAVNHELSQARSGFLPTVDINSSTGKEFANNSTTRARQLDGDDSRTTSLQTTSFGLTIRQLLFDGFDTLSQVERQEGRVRSAARRVRETSEFTGQDAVEGYLESLRQRELIRINEENVRAHEIFLELVRARVAGGAAGKAEEEQAQQRLAAARDAVAQADGLKRDADARYRRIVGEEPVAMSRPNVPVDALPATVDQAIELAIQFNPTIRVSRSDVQIAEAEMKQTKSTYWPQLSFEVNANSNRNSGGTRGQDTTVSALLVMNYNWGCPR
jgi:outer membrane protein, adhesin transport system